MARKLVSQDTNEPVKNSEDFVSNLSDSRVGNFTLKIVRNKSLKSI